MPALPPLRKRLLRTFEDHAPSLVVSFPENARLVGSTDSWLAMDAVDAEKRHTYFLQNIFSKTAVLLPELDAVPSTFKVRKVLMQSPPTGLVVVKTHSSNYPIILVQPGKGVWLPEPQQATLLTRITDIAFLGGNLYGITTDEDLICLRIGFDSQGKPKVTSIQHVINHQIGDNVSNDDNNEAVEDEDDTWSDASEWTTDDDDDEIKSIAHKIDEALEDDMYVLDGVHFEFEDNDPSKHLVLTIWYLVESCGKLLMVRRQQQNFAMDNCFTRRVEVFAADVSTCAWVPMSGGLDGQALFISTRFSKSVSAGGVIENDAICFIDSGEVFNMRSETTSAPNRAAYFAAFWLFLPGSF
jgi:hypothetical protein